MRYRETNHETPGRLTRDQIRNDPHAANAANLAIDARRPQPGSTWVGNVTTLQIDEDSSLQAGLVYHTYPMDLNESLYRQQLDYANLNATLDYRRRHRLFGLDSETTVGLRVTHDLDADVRESLRFASNGYAAGTRTRDFRHHGTDSTLHVSNTLAFNDRLRMQAGLALINTRRDVQVTWPSSGGRLREQDWDYAPRLGFTWQHSAQTQWFGNLSRSVEAPHPWSMIWGSNQYFGPGNGPSTGRQRAPVPMQNQTATTLELGARGDAALGRWELTGYYAHVNHELLSVELQPLPNLFIAENNASPTVHRGIEAGLDSTLWQAAPPPVAAPGVYLQRLPLPPRCTFRQQPPARPAAPRLPGRAALRSCIRPVRGTEHRIRLAHRGGLCQQLLGRQPCDLRQPHRLRRPGGRWQAWAEMRNIGNRHYAATVTPGYDDAGRDVARSTPGEGRGVYAVCAGALIDGRRRRRA